MAGASPGNLFSPRAARRATAARFSPSRPCSAGTPHDDARFEDWDYGGPEDKLTSLDGEDLDTAEVSADLNVEGVHELWRNADPQPRHPLAPLVRACWNVLVEMPALRQASA